MKVAELMQTNVLTIRPDIPVAEAVISLADAHVSGLPVVDGNGQILGVVSTTDLLGAEAEASDDRARASLFKRTQVRDIMTPHAQTIAPDAEVKEAAQQMLYVDVRRLFVVSDEKLVGVISTKDIVQAVATGKI